MCPLHPWFLSRSCSSWPVRSYPPAGIWLIHRKLKELLFLVAEGIVQVHTLTDASGATNLAAVQMILSIISSHFKIQA